jgi:pentatricopeptide repeat protein
MALAFLEMARDDGIEPNVFMYSAAIWTAEACREPDVALHLLDEMKESSCPPNDISYLGVLSALAYDGRAHDAVELFQEMKEYGVRTNTKVFLVRGF